MENPPILAPLPIRDLDVSYFSNSLTIASQRLGLIPRQALGHEGSFLEATFSAQIENMQVEADDLLAYHTSAQDDSVIITDDLREAYNYVVALAHCKASMDDPNGLPLCTRLLCEAHGLLFRGSTRASYSEAGSLRSIQNYIGNGHEIVYMPPAPGMLQELMSNLEQHCHSEDEHTLVQAAILHVHFESIHPFVDGNGRIGRLLIALFLYQEGVIVEPGFYLSRYFRQWQMNYYHYLNRVREENGWEAWVKFFLDGITETVNDGIERFGRNN